VRPAARSPAREEPLYLERVQDASDVGCAVADRASFESGGIAVPWTGVRDQAKSTQPGFLDERWVLKARARGPVVPHHNVARCLALDPHVEDSSVRDLDRAHTHA